MPTYLPCTYSWSSCVCLSVCLSVRPSVRPSVCLSMCVCLLLLKCLLAQQQQQLSCLRREGRKEQDFHREEKFDEPKGEREREREAKWRKKEKLQEEINGRFRPCCLFDDRRPIEGRLQAAATTWILLVTYHRPTERERKKNFFVIGRERERSEAK